MSRSSPGPVAWPACEARPSAGVESRGTASRQTRSRNRPHPSITLSVWSLQSTSSAGGPVERWNRRRASAPTDSRYLEGATVLPFDFDILDPSIRTMPWVNRRAKGSRRPGRPDAHVGQGPRVEAGVEQVQDGVLDTPDVLVDRHPAGGRLRIERAVRSPRIAEAQEVPRRVDEGVHGVGLAGGGPAALRTGRLLELVARGQRGDAGRLELHVIGGEDGQLLVWARARCRGRGSRRWGSGIPRTAAATRASPATAN